MARERKFTTEDVFQETKNILLEQGYEGFTFGILAQRLDVSRGALYKYYDNKEELITEYMLFEMDQFMKDLEKIHQYAGFHDQFDFLLETFFKYNKIHQILGLSYEIPANTNKNVKRNKQQLEQIHVEMYGHLGSFIQTGRREGLLRPGLADELILGFIFQSIAIPNHFGIPQGEWMKMTKEFLSHGMFIKK